MDKRPTLVQIWNGYRQPVPIEHMRRGMVFDIAWFDPNPTFETVDAIVNRAAEYPVAEFKLRQGPIGWVLLGRWRGDDAWEAVTYD